MQRLVQLALDFFDPPVAPAGPAAAPGVKAADSKPKLPPAPDGKAPVAPKTVVNRPAAPAVPLPSLLSPAEFRHPQASREVLLGDAVVAYALQRARRRTIGFTVGADGLSVRAPSWVTLSGVDSALREKSEWILRKLSEARERHQRMEGGRIAWADGAVLPYLPAIIDYVVAHELAHLRVMDHSPRFWDTVATVVPDYAQLRSRLRDEPAPLW